MKNKANVTVIIPVHSTDYEKFDDYFSNALKSISDNKVLPEKVLVVAPPELHDKLNGLKLKDMTDVEIIANNGATDFASQINYGVNQVKTDYFSFLEFDDEYSNLWFDNFDKYSKEFPNVSIFLGIINDVNIEGNFLGYTNEIAWAFEFTEKQGFVDADTLKEYPNFNPDGMVMKVEDFKKMGGYKKNIKLTFNLEFLLRACEQAFPILVIPKISYRHVNMRPNSIFWEYKNGESPLSEKESDFWLKMAQKEFYYEDDREIKYNKDEEEK